jgi:hypothetical protein
VHQGAVAPLTIRLRKWCVTSTALRALHSMFLRTSSAVLRPAAAQSGGNMAATHAQFMFSPNQKRLPTRVLCRANTCKT